MFNSLRITIAPLYLSIFHDFSIVEFFAECKVRNIITIKYAKNLHYCTEFSHIINFHVHWWHLKVLLNQICVTRLLIYVFSLYQTVFHDRPIIEFFAEYKARNLYFVNIITVKCAQNLLYCTEFCMFCNFYMLWWHLKVL